MTEKILGLDLGTNSIGWAFIERDLESGTGRIIQMGSRILPTDAELLSKYEKGQAASKNAARRQARGARRLKDRYKLRRDRLIRACIELGWMPPGFEPGHKLDVSRQSLQEMRELFGPKAISDDWVTYYLRHKALDQAVTKEELARILYHMNQRRGFRSNRKAGNELPDLQDGEEVESRAGRVKQVEIVEIADVIPTEEKQRGNVVYEIVLTDGRSGSLPRKQKPEWKQQKMELEITTITSKSGEVRCEFRPLNNSDKDTWAKKKLMREHDIIESGHLYPGRYYLHELLRDPHYQIRDVTIDRKFYREELTAILQKQQELQPQLFNRADALERIASGFYKHNADKQQAVRQAGIISLFLDDIIYFQRPLRSKKSSIADCRFERRNYRDPQTGKLQPYKVAPVSSPVFLEFRAWQNALNIGIYQRNATVNGKPVPDHDVSASFIDKAGREKIFELFNTRKTVAQKDILKLFRLKEEDYGVNLYKLNEQKELPGNETFDTLSKAFKRAGVEEIFTAIWNNPEKRFLCWHIFYSIETAAEVSNALQRHFGLSEEEASIAAKAPAFKQQYGSLSHKALKRLIPLMRCGSYWSWDNIDPATQLRLDKIINGELDEGISDHVRGLFFHKYQIDSRDKCQGLLVPMASYAVYGIHSERDTAFYEKPEQLIPAAPLNLRNPLVEQVVNETLRMVHDIWKAHGRPTAIHVELARDLKKNAAEREEMSKNISANEETNKRIAAILRELKIGNPQSGADIERLKLWEQQADEQARAEMVKFKRPSEPTKDEIQKYKLWAEQRFLSPYSGKPIPLSRLFSRDYDIDHIIPRSRLFDDSLENKVVVESHLNREKGNMTALEYILRGSAGGYDLLSPDDYAAHVTRYFYRKKKRLLLSEDVPAGFSNRQLVESRYISRKIAELLAPVSEDRRNPILFSSGSVSAELRSAWGLGEVMKQLVKWRFDRLDAIAPEQGPWVTYVQQTDAEGNPTGKQILKLKGYEKRIDHRHHALDALVVACTTRVHIKYLNDLNAAQYRRRVDDEDMKVFLPKLLEAGKDDYLQSRKFRLPWPGFVREATGHLERMIVSFRNRIRIAGRKANRRWCWVEQPDGSFKKKWLKVTDDAGNVKTSPYVRQSLHKATYMGKIRLREYKEVSALEALRQLPQVANKDDKAYLKSLLAKAGGDPGKANKLYTQEPLLDKDGNPRRKINIWFWAEYYTNRVDIGSGFDEKRIQKIPDPVMQETLRTHLKHIEALNKGRSKEESIDPFGAEGLEILNRDRAFPITKVSIMEASESKFEIRPGAFTEADKGTNIFLAVYTKIESENVKKYVSVPLRDVIQAKMSDLSFVENMDGFKIEVFMINELVYLPDESEVVTRGEIIQATNLYAKVYRLISHGQNQCYYLPNYVSSVISDKIEFGSLNKSERALDGRMIKQFCKKLKVDRLGNATII